MAENKEVFVFIGPYDNLKDAQLDYAAVKELHRQGVIGTYDAAVVDKDAQGEVHVHKDEKQLDIDTKNFEKELASASAAAK